MDDKCKTTNEVSGEAVERLIDWNKKITKKPNRNIEEMNYTFKAIDDSMDLFFKVVSAVNLANGIQDTTDDKIKTFEFMFEFMFDNHYMVKLIQFKKLHDGYSICISVIIDTTSNRIIYIGNSRTISDHVDRQYAYGILMTYLKNIVIMINESAKSIIDTYISINN